MAHKDFIFTSESVSEARKESASVLPLEHLFTNSSMFEWGARTGRILQPVSWRSLSITPSPRPASIITASGRHVSM